MSEVRKLRLGGMALRNGLLVHGPSHWAAAVRSKDGSVRVASGPKPRVYAFDEVPGVRGRIVVESSATMMPASRPTDRSRRGIPTPRDSPLPCCARSTSMLECRRTLDLVSYLPNEDANE